ncbi:fimbrial protein [Rahnella selenatireducens]|uniref:fimbrial protein n=1 Tax=Rahnella selenatireducens TaxID=3389797 RepID=UPI003967DE5B
MKKRVVLYLLAALLMQSTRAAQTGDSVNYNFKGHFLVLSPCIISDDKVLDIAFNTVGVKKVDGINYRQVIPYTVECKGEPDNTALNLTVAGTAENFDAAAVTTNAAGLGIQIQADGQPLKLNTPLATTLGALSSLVLTAVPVKDPATELTAQGFTATATLKVDYQ